MVRLVFRPYLLTCFSVRVFFLWMCEACQCPLTPHSNCRKGTKRPKCSYEDAPHKILWMTSNNFSAPKHHRHHIKNYFRKVPFCLTGRELKSRLGSNLEFVIITGCSKVPLWLLSWQWRWTGFSLGSGRWGTQQWCASSANQNLHGQLDQHHNHIQHCYYPWQLPWRYSEPYITHWLGLATHMSSVRLYSIGANCHCQFPV